MPMKLKNYCSEQPILNFELYNFLIFLNTQLLETKMSEKTKYEYDPWRILVCGHFWFLIWMADS